MSPSSSSKMRRSSDEVVEMCVGKKDSIETQYVSPCLHELLNDAGSAVDENRRSLRLKPEPRWTAMSYRHRRPRTEDGQAHE